MHIRVVPHLCVVAQVLEPLRPARNARHLIEQPDSPGLADRTGELSAELRKPVQVGRPHAISRHIDELAGIYVLAFAEARSRVLEQHRLAHAPRASQHHELVVERSTGDIVEQTGPIAKIVGRSRAEHLIAVHPRCDVRACGRGPPPRVAISKSLAYLIISHPPPVLIRLDAQSTHRSSRWRPATADRRRPRSSRRHEYGRPQPPAPRRRSRARRRPDRPT